MIRFECHKCEFIGCLLIGCTAGPSPWSHLVMSSTKLTLGPEMTVFSVVALQSEEKEHFSVLALQSEEKENFQFWICSQKRRRIFFGEYFIGFRATQDMGNYISTFVDPIVGLRRRRFQAPSKSSQKHPARHRSSAQKQNLGWPDQRRGAKEMDRARIPMDHRRDHLIPVLYLRGKDLGVRSRFLHQPSKLMVIQKYLRMERLGFS
ncbi:uncharacterized protein LOC121398785 [Xenopus laevis]|uniref:Uncharacterized protein LOC121398785 n=1 Tax=Xenopus laevis TaxID=8355 RepID=A0A8J1LZ68_XENLA|nr:uncharacterized protein LOC121398785 [Xenopus laevis]